MEQLSTAATFGRLSISLFGDEDNLDIPRSPVQLSPAGSSPGVSLGGPHLDHSVDGEARAAAKAIIERAASMCMPEIREEDGDDAKHAQGATVGAEDADAANAGNYASQEPAATAVQPFVLARSASSSASSTSSAASAPSSPGSAGTAASATSAGVAASAPSFACSASALAEHAATAQRRREAQLRADSPTALLDALAAAPVAPESEATRARRTRGLEALVRALKRDLERRDETVRGLRGALVAGERRNGQLTGELVSAKMRIAEMQAESDVLRNARAKLEHGAEAYAAYTRDLEKQLIAAKALSFMHAERAAERASQLEAAQRAAAATREAAAAAEAAATSRDGRASSTRSIRRQRKPHKQAAPHVVSTLLLGGQPGKGGKGSMWRAPAPYREHARRSPDQRLQRRGSSAGPAA